MAVIEVDGLTYTYPGSPAPAVKGISFKIEEGQLAAVVGANGAGKSTLLLALAGLIPALFQGEMEGTVSTAGMDTRRHTPGQFAGRVGLVLQNPANQFSGMRYTVFEEVAFGLENLGAPRAEMPARIERALAQTGLSLLKERSPFSLSGGEQQRLALASVLVMEPPVLLLDEPTAMLDPQGSQELFAVIRDVAKAGVTVVVASHNLEWIGRDAQRVIALAGGEVILDGPPGVVLCDPLLEEAVIGRQRITRAAEQGRTAGLWPGDRELPVTVDQAAEGFRQARTGKAGMEGDGAHSDR